MIDNSTPEPAGFDAAKVQDRRRLAALERYAILDTAPEQAYDDIAMLASQMCAAPTALVSLVASDRQWFKARTGFPSGQTDLSRSVCQHGLDHDDLLIIADLSLDERTRDNPLVTDRPHIRFYAGAPLIVADGVSLGMLCVIDTEPRPAGLSGQQAEALRALARLVVAQLELRLTVADRDRRAERLQLAVDNAEVGFWDVDVVNDRLVWPERTKAMFGISPDVSVTMQDFYDGLHPEDRAYTSAVYADAADPAKRTLYDVEYRTVGKEDGIVRWVAAKGRGIFDTDGRCLRVVGTAMDITARKAMEQQIRDSEAQFRTLFDTMDEGFCVIEFVDGPHGPLSDYVHISANPAYQRHAGIADVVGQYVRAMVPDEADGWVALYRGVLETGDPIRFERELEATGRYLELAAFRVEPRNRNQVAVIFQDITARKHAELALRDLNETLEKRVADGIAERKLLADLVEGTDAFVQVAGPDFRWLSINRAASDEFERIYGIRPRIGQSMLDALNDFPDHRADVEAIWSRALAGEQFSAVGEFGDPGRNRRHYEMKFNTLRDGAGRAIGAYQFVHDVTDRVNEQQRVAQMEDALRQAQKMEAVGQLTGGIAHDFNNMLAIVIGSLDLLKRRMDEGDTRNRRYVDAATDGALRAAALTQRLLAFSRQQPLQPEPVDANKLVAGMSDMLRHSLGGEVQIETVLAGGLWRTHADPNQLENVILNLAINARDAMEGSGRLTIETANCHLDARYVTDHLGVPAGQYVMIAVTDTGSGMSPEVIAKAFDPFFTTKSVGKGTGLGLSQVYGFVKQTGGHVKIYSEADEGTTIKVYLPRLIVSEPERADEGPQKDIPRGDSREVILVVEDEPGVRQYSVDALTELGYRVLEADGAAAALRLLDAHPDIAMLFTDVVMPEINGAKLAEQARARRPDLKILFTTGYTRNAVVHNGRLDAGVELIGKPFTVEELAAKVRAVLDAA